MLNRIVLVGRLTRDPVRRTTQTDVAVTSFTIAVDNNRIKNADGSKSTLYIDCVVWNNHADNVAKFCHKGSLVGVDGSLTQRTFDRRDGSKQTVFEVRCDSVQFLEPKGSTPEVSEESNYMDQTQPEEEKNTEELDVVDDDLPF